MLLNKFITPKNSIVAFWKMEENEEQLYKFCNLTAEDKKLLSNCSAQKRHIEILSVRALMKVVGINQTIFYKDRKPFVKNGYISISHSADIATIIWNENHIVGIDIEAISSRILHVAKRVFSEKELEFAGDDLEKLTILWNCKECVYKMTGVESVDFREMIQVKDFYSDKIICNFYNEQKQNRYELYWQKIENNTMVIGEKLNDL